jgi:hypothetical protein
MTTSLTGRYAKNISDIAHSYAALHLRNCSPSNSSDPPGVCHLETWTG